MSKYYVKGKGATWRGAIEVIDATHYYWHINWPELSTQLRTTYGTCAGNVEIGWWVPKLDEDLEMDEGL